MHIDYDIFNCADHLWTKNEVHLWHLDANATSSNVAIRQYLPLLSNAERSRYQRFNFEQDKHRYLISRGTLRTILSMYLPAYSPQMWQFDQTTNGKPFVASTQTCQLNKTLHFNVSHTKWRTILVFSSSEQVGVDIEWLVRQTKFKTIIKRFFSDEEVNEIEGLKSESSQRRRFFEMWTLKEAMIKAKGERIAQALRTTEVSMEYPPIRKRTEISGHWQLESYVIGREHVAALALLQSQPCNIISKHFHADFI